MDVINFLKHAKATKNGILTKPEEKILKGIKKIDLSLADIWTRCNVFSLKIQENGVMCFGLLVLCQY